jgi:hypothetical protein
MSKTTKSHNSKCKCPLCGSNLTKAKFDKVTGIWKESKKELDKAKVEAKKMKQEVEKEKKKLAGEKKKLQSEKKKNAEVIKKKNLEMKKFKENSKKETAKKVKEATGKALKKQGQQLAKAEETNKKLKDQLKNAKRGVNEINVGFEYEQKLATALKKEYPKDIIKVVGKGGDVLHRIFKAKKELGSIIYECKRTQSHQTSHVTQAANAKTKWSSTFAVLVTTGKITKTFHGFKVERDVVITRAEGALMISKILRNQVVEMDSQRLDEEKKNISAKRALNYMNSNAFKLPVNNILRLVDDDIKNLKKEMTAHFRFWTTRHQNLIDIRNCADNVVENSVKSVKGLKLSKIPKEKSQINLTAPKIN